MFSQLQQLSKTADGRYATDTELEFLSEYLRSFNLRLGTYSRLQTLEGQILQQVQTRMRSLDPTLLQSGEEDLTGKWKRDTIRVLRYSAIAMLCNDADLFRDHLLYWMQTIMKAFGAQRSCEVTYKIMQEVVQEHLSPTEAKLLCPFLELTRVMLGNE